MEKQKIPYPSIGTPALLLDMDKLEANIKEMSQLAAEAGVKLRPHIKIHESAFITKLQIEAGAYAIEVGPVAQAEAMAEEGFDDIVIAHPFYGGHKLEILKRLLRKVGLKIAVVVDMFEQAEGIYAHEMGAKPTAEGVDKTAFEVASNMAETARTLRREGIQVEHVSVGASPTFRSTCLYIKQGKFPEITEIHPGSCIIGDMIYVTGHAMTEDRCALTVLTSVVSTSHSDHAVIDAGSKTFGAESMIARRDVPGFFWEGKPSFGSVRGRPDLWFGRLSAESGCICYKDFEKKLSLGERLEIIPNNAIVVINIHDRLYGVRNGVLEKIISVTGRGRGN